MRDQNSMVLLSKARFKSFEELTDSALKVLGKGSPVERGDLLVVAAQDVSGESFVVASFHGDTNGLASKPVATAVSTIASQQPAGSSIVFGLDANTYLKPDASKQGVAEFLEHC